MKYEQINGLAAEEFCRFSDVKREAFNKMLAILIDVEIKKKATRVRKNKLSIEDRLLMALESLTYFHVSQSYGMKREHSI